MGIALPVGELQDSSTSLCRQRGLLIDGTFAGPQAAMHLRNESVDVDGSAASPAETVKNAQYARSGQIFFGEGSCKPTTLLMVEALGTLPKPARSLSTSRRALYL